MLSINDISNRTILRILTLTALFIGAIALAARLREVLTWIAIAFFLAVAINPAVEFVSKYMPKKSRGLAAALVFGSIIALLVFILVTLVPPMISQTQTLIKKVPDLSKTLQDSNSQFAELARKY